MAENVNCETHGPQEATYVCQHLAASLNNKEKVGFFFSRQPRGDAWCARCEEVRIREGGPTGDWNEKSEAFAKITILCGACYDRVRAGQEF